MAPKLVSKLVNFGSVFGFVFYVLELFRCLLEAFLGLPKLSWTALDPKKQKEKQLFFNVFANAVLRYFGALDGPLGPILAPLGLIWSQNEPPKLPQKLSEKISKNLSNKMTPKMKKTNPNLAAKMDPKISQDA